MGKVQRLPIIRSRVNASAGGNTVQDDAVDLPGADQGHGERVRLTVSCEFAVHDASRLVAVARLLAAADPTPLERNRVDGVYVFTPSASSAIDLAMREITTAADALERMLLAAVPRELPGAWATRGSVCADTPGTYGLTGEIEAEPEDEVGLDEFGSGILPPQAARDY